MAGVPKNILDATLLEISRGTIPDTTINDVHDVFFRFNNQPKIFLLWSGTILLFTFKLQYQLTNFRLIYGYLYSERGLKDRDKITRRYWLIVSLQTLRSKQNTIV